MSQPVMLSVLMLGMLSLSTFGGELHVSPKGDDAHEGTRERPLRTMQAAVARLRPGDICRVHPGIYRETLATLPSGTAENPITIMAEEPHQAVLTGLEPLTGWTRHRGDVWVAPAPQVLPGQPALFIDGQPGIRARWPNRHSRDFLEWEGVTYDPARSNNHELVSDALPERPDGYWKNAVLWVMGGAKWTSWSVRLSGYDARRKALLYSFADKKRARSAGNNFMALSHPQGGFFVLLGDEREIDAPGEFYVDEAARKVYLHVEPGQDPNRLKIELQTRAFAVALQDKTTSHLRFMGFRMVAASMNWGRTEHVTLENLRCSWLGTSDGGDTGYGIDRQIGIYLNGSHNTVRDSEIAYSHGNGLVVYGNDNRIVNCHIHDIDFLGSYDAPLIVSGGARNLISHNTIHDTGRDGLRPNGQANVIQYNDISRMGRICHDLGATYVCATNGGGSEYHHNWVHDNVAKGTRMGIYLDNFTCNNFIYKNVVWNIDGCDIRLNRPGQNNFVINNTMFGKCGNWGRWQTDWLYNCAYLNNAVIGKIAPHPQALKKGNVEKLPKNVLKLGDDVAQSAHRLDHSQAVPVPGILAGKPHVGAYAPGETWRAGHDFSQRPDPQWQLAKTPLRNLLNNATFTAWANSWTRLPRNEAVAYKYWGGGITTSYAERYSIIDTSACLKEADGAMEQKVAGVQAGQRYQLSFWHRRGAEQEDAAIVLYIKEQNGKVHQSHVLPSKDTWQLATLEAVLTSTEATVGVRSAGAGQVWIDSASLVGVVAGLEPQLPGLAPSQPAPKRILGKPAPKRTAPLVVPANSVVKDVIAQQPGCRLLGQGQPATLEMQHDGKGTVTLAVSVPLGAPLAVDKTPRWNGSDGVEFCFSDSDNNARHSVFVLHGFPNGSFEVSEEAGASRSECERLAKGVQFAATIAPDRRSWRGQFTVSLPAAGLTGGVGTVLDFNVGVYRRHDRQWLQWTGTPGQTWLVKQAGQMSLQ